jgi:stage II sporulation protein R
MLCALLGYLVYAGAVHSEDALAKDVLRLHILANSNMKEDQRIKLCVRDSVLEFIEQNAGDTQSKQEVASWVQAHLDDIEEVAERVVHEQGEDYSARAEIGTFAFPVKSYGEKVYPAGMYDALRVNLGAARGENWWCVIFPPLCLADLGLAPQATDAPQATAIPKATSTPKATEMPKPKDTPKATAKPQADQVAQVIGGRDSYGYMNGVFLESLFMEWFFG